MQNLSPTYELIPMKDKVIVENGFFGEMVGGMAASSTSLSRGSGNKSATIDSQGIYIGSAEFGTAPFSVDMDGNLVATAISVTGGTMKYGKTSITDSVNAGWFISPDGLYVGAAADASALKYTLATGTFDFIGTISSRSTSAVATAINASGNLVTDLINARLDSSSKAILSDFSFGATDYAGGVKAGDIAWNPTSGVITGGSGIVLYRSGIVGAKAGIVKFSIDATTGDATFAGTLAAASGTLGAITIGSNAWHVDSSGNMWWGNFATYAAASIKISNAGVANLSGLVVGTNVDLGTAMDSAATTTLIGATVTATYISTLGLVVGTQIGQGTARQVFTSTPTTPYYVGDLWAAGSSGDLKRCITQRLSGAYNAADWDLASKYTDDSGVTTIIGSTVTTSFVNALNITALGTVTTGTLNGLLIQTSATANEGVKLSSAYGIKIFDQTLSLYEGSTLYGYLGTYSGYYNIASVSDRNIKMSVGTGSVFVDGASLSSATSGATSLGLTSQYWSNVYTNNLTTLSGEYLHDVSGRMTCSTDFSVVGSTHCTGNVYTGGVSSSGGSVNCALLHLAYSTTSPSTAGDIRNYASGATDQFRGVPGDGTWVGSFDMTAV